MPDLIKMSKGISGRYYGPTIYRDETKKKTSKKTAPKTNKQVEKTPVNAGSPQPYNNYLAGYGVQPFGLSQPGEKNRPPEPVDYQPVSVQEFPYAAPGPYYNNYLQDTYGVQPFGYVPAEEKGTTKRQSLYGPKDTINPFGDPYGGLEESRLPGPQGWTHEKQLALNEAFQGLHNFDFSYNVGVQETGKANYGGSGYGGSGYGNNYYPQYRYGNSQQAASWYNNMLNWKIS